MVVVRCSDTLGQGVKMGLQFLDKVFGARIGIGIKLMEDF